MIYLLDTNTCIRYLNKRSPEIIRHLAAHQREEIALCVINKAELYYGAYKSARREENLALLAEFFTEFRTLDFTDLAAQLYGSLRAGLERQGTPIGPNDMQIAAIALAYQATLVTHNVKEFERVPNLPLEDWER